MKVIDRRQKILREPKPITTSQEWAKVVHELFVEYQKMMRKHQEKGDGIQTFDLTDSMTKRREKAILNTIPEIYRRYELIEGSQPSLGEVWRNMNLPFTSYSNLDQECHILFAASVWILDQLRKKEDRMQVYRYLPKDESLLDDLVLHDAWLADYDVDLVYSIEYVLHNRNLIEIDGAGYPRTLTCDALAKQKVVQDENRENYEKLIAMIPQEAIDKATEKYKKCFWEWVDIFYSGVRPFLQKDVELFKQIRESQIKFNGMNDELDALMKRIETLKKQKPNALVKKPPLVPASLPEIASIPVFKINGSDYDKAMLKGSELCARMDRLSEKIDDTKDMGAKLHQELRKYQARMTRVGYISADDVEDFETVDVPAMQPMKIENPYELCFALVYLIETDDDLPWLYGAGCGFMAEVAETLPWGLYDFDEITDETWMGSTPIALKPQLPKSVVIPDLYERKYGEELPRSLAHIIYEETGCILPSDLHIYDDKVKKLSRYGIRGKDEALTLMLMSTLASTRHSLNAINLDSDIDLLLSEDNAPKKENLDAGALMEENKRLKEALHSSEKESRETKKALENIKAMAAREHRELSDLRSLLFNKENEVREKPVKGYSFPYETQNRTVIFGGHDSFLRVIKPMLPNVKFVDPSNMAFNPEIIRNADVVWIQNNCISHPQYWSVVKNCKISGVQMRYFAYASAEKCAEQVVEGDR